jgi:hypothetical protein
MSMQKESVEGIVDERGEHYKTVYGSIPESIPRRGRAGKEKEAPKFRNVSIKQPSYSADDVKRLMDLVVLGNKGIKYNPNLTVEEGARNYIAKRKLEGWDVEVGDLDEDSDTPDNVVIMDKNLVPRVIDGYSLSKRRPDFLFQRPQYKHQIADFKSQYDDAHFKIAKSDLRQYYKTHSTESSRAEESFENYVPRHRKEKQEKLLHKMYLESTPKEQRNDAAEAKFYKDYEDVKEHPSISIRRIIAREVKKFEQNNKIKYVEKFKLLAELFNESVARYKSVNKIPANQPLIGVAYKTLRDQMNGVDFPSYFNNILTNRPYVKVQ